MGTGDVGAVAVFIRAGVDVAYDGQRAFRCAVMNGHLDIAKMLLAAGVNLSNLPFDPIVLAVSFGYPEIIKWLLANGAIIIIGDFTALNLTVDLALNVSTSSPYGVPEEVWTACVDVLLNHSLGWRLSLSLAEQVAKNVAKFAPCKAKAVAWLAHHIGRT
ncbi:MAG: ankyrin repeat domain-containing protein [Verrucomicrobia bacterium]|nr:ankyrin repeat domain-containing protein [Verrucomicrobiota bacterium]